MDALLALCDEPCELEPMEDRVVLEELGEDEGLVTAFAYTGLGTYRTWGRWPRLVDESGVKLREKKGRSRPRPQLWRHVRALQGEGKFEDAMTPLLDTEYVVFGERNCFRKLGGLENAKWDVGVFWDSTLEAALLWKIDTKGFATGATGAGAVFEARRTTAGALHEYMMVCKRRVGTMTFLISGETDAFDLDWPGEEAIDRRAVLDAAAELYSGTRKKLKPWKFVQCQLLGIPRIVTNDNDNVRPFEQLQDVSKLANTVAAAVTAARSTPDCWLIVQRRNGVITYAVAGEQGHRLGEAAVPCWPSQLFD